MDHRVDLYATGVILYESVTGQVPFNADTFNELLFKIVLEEPRPVEQLVPEVDRNFAAIINKAMAREPANRFQSARDFQQTLEQWASGAGAELANALRLPPAKPIPTVPARSRDKPHNPSSHCSARERRASGRAPVGPQHRSNHRARGVRQGYLRRWARSQSSPSRASRSASAPGELIRTTPEPALNAWPTRTKLNPNR